MLVTARKSKVAWRRVLLVALLVGFGASGFSTNASAKDLARDFPDEAQELAERYAPIIMLKAQEAACDRDGEPYAPTAADIVLDNSDVLLRQVGEGNPVVMRGPGADDLAGLGEGFFLDFPGNSLEPGCIYERDFQRYAGGRAVTVYAHLVQQEDRPDQLALQYWFYWYYNDWNNKHESDWEGIQLLFDASSIGEALETEPTSIGYAQHEGGERADWRSSKSERDGTHPVVYSSAGSHASYFGSSVYMGRSASEGFGCDSTDGPSNRHASEVVVLPDEVDDPQDPFAWLSYEGRWGERQKGAFNGPTGPLAKERWLEPITWHDALRSSSVVIPAGDSVGDQVIGTFCGSVEWGSSQLITLTTSPVRLLIVAFVLSVLARWLIRRTKWGLVADRPLAMRRRAGQIIRLAYWRYRSSWRVLVRFGVVYIPALFLAGLLGGLMTLVPLLGDLLELSGERSGTRLMFALSAGCLTAFVAAYAVHAMVAEHLRSTSVEPDDHEPDAVRRTWERRAPLASTGIRAYGIVIVLMISIIGIPWGVRQLVRYQFSAQVVVLESLDGTRALQRSSDLVRGRWWHTALMIAIFNALPLATSFIVGLLLLLAVAGLPLWLFSTVMALVYAVLVPLTATAQTMLYGDAVAELQESRRFEVTPATAGV